MACPAPALSLTKQIQFTGLPARICWLGYADAGYEIALKARERFKLGVEAHLAARIPGARA